MTVYEPGQRIALVHTADPYTALRPGDTGTVLHHDQHTNTVHIAWDTGSRLALCLDVGDRVDLLPVHDDQTRWRQVLHTESERGTRDGQQAARQWISENTRPGADYLKDVARNLLQLLAEEEDVDEILPRYDGRSYAQPATQEQLSLAFAGGDPARWRPLSSTRFQEAVWRYRSSFDTAARDHVCDWARRTLIPSAGGRDLTELDPKQIRIGRMGVFSGEWMWQSPADGPDYLRLGFVGTLIDWWNGWAVFSCTRHVAESIVADQQHVRTHDIEVLQASGMTAQDARQEVGRTLADLRFDGDIIVADQRTMMDDPEAITRTGPDADGRYVVMGANWCWEAVDPYACDHIVGDLPEPGDEQQFVPITHTPGLRVPHSRLRLHLLQDWPSDQAITYTAAVLLNGQQVATAGTALAGGADLHITDPAAHPAMRTFLAGSRYQGEPVGWPRLLDALACEAHLDTAVATATRSATTLIRAVDNAGYTHAVRQILRQPASWEDFNRLSADLPRHDDQRWEIWTGQRWLTLPAGTPRPA